MAVGNSESTERTWCKSRRGVFFLALSVVTFLFIVYALIFIRLDTPASRRDIAHRAQELGQVIREVPASAESRAALSELLEILRGDWSFARVYVCGTLARLGPLAADAVPDLIAASHCGDLYVEPEAVRALASVGVNTPEVYDFMMSIVRDMPSSSFDGYSSKQLNAIDALPNFPQMEAEIRPILERLSRNENWLLAQSAKEALKELTHAVDRSKGAGLIDSRRTPSMPSDPSAAR